MFVSVTTSKCTWERVSKCASEWVTTSKCVCVCVCVCECVCVWMDQCRSMCVGLHSMLTHFVSFSIKISISLITHVLKILSLASWAHNKHYYYYILFALSPTDKNSNIQPFFLPSKVSTHSFPNWLRCSLGRCEAVFQPIRQQLQDLWHHLPQTHGLQELQVVLCLTPLCHAAQLGQAATTANTTHLSTVAVTDLGHTAFKRSCHGLMVDTAIYCCSHWPDGVTAIYCSCQ